MAMIRLRFHAFALTAIALSAGTDNSNAQPPQKGPIQFKPFGGVNPEQFQQSAMTRWIGQVLLEAGEVRSDVTESKLGFGQKTLINSKADAVIQAAENLHRLAKQGANRNQQAQAFALLDQTVNDLGGVINQNILAKQVAGEALGKLEYATQQLGGIFASGVGGDPASRLKFALRLSDALDDQTEALRELAAERLGQAYTPDLDQTIRA